MKKFFKQILGLLAGAITEIASYYILVILLTKLGNLIFSAWNWIDPESASWALIIAPPCISVTLGSLAARLVSKTHRPYCIAVIVVNVLEIAVNLIAGKYGLGLALARSVFSVTAILCAIRDPDDLLETDSYDTY